MMGWKSPGRTRDLTNGNHQPLIYRTTSEAGQRRAYGLSGAPGASEGSTSFVSNSGCCGKTAVGNVNGSAVRIRARGVLGAARSRSWSLTSSRAPAILRSSVTGVVKLVDIRFFSFLLME